VQADQVTGQNEVENLAPPIFEELVAKAPARHHRVKVLAMAAFRQDGVPASAVSSPVLNVLMKSNSSTVKSRNPQFWQADISRRESFAVMSTVELWPRFEPLFSSVAGFVTTPTAEFVSRLRLQHLLRTRARCP